MPPDIVLLVDYPGFNLPLARDAHNMGLKVVYYIPPQVWAWAPRRLRYLKLYVDEVISILPFEKAFYKRYRIKVNFVGHPLLDEVDTEREDERYIALLPGSRMSEIRQILPLLLSIADSFPDEKFVVSLSSPKHEDYVTPLLKGKNSRIEIDTGSTIEVLSRSKLAVAASGTVTLECAIMGVAMVIVYKVSPLTWLIGRALVKVPHIGLVNLVAGRRVVPEFLQGDATRDRIVPVIKSILGNRDEEMKRELCRVKELLGERGASRRAAEIIAKLK